jgi:hypothetical protein
MIVPLLLAVAFGLGVDGRRLLLLAGATYLPAVTGAIVLLALWRRQAIDDDRPARFCEAVASESRAGASLRDALIAAARSVGFRLSESAPIEELATSAGDAFPSIGQEIRLTVLNAARAGTDVALLFDEVGSMSLASSEIRREVRTAMAPARATALVLCGAPLVYLAGRATSGTLASTLASSPQRLAALIGLGLFGLGLSITALIVWRAER